jgi:hypothetical protein
MRKPEVRCAIYSRKSSEEGLEQDFNSLHAQSEACEAYVKSQKHEGWRTLPAAEIEPLVIGRLLAMLRDSSWVLDQTLPPCATVVGRQALLERATELSNRLETADPRQKRGLLLGLLAQVVLEGEHVVIIMRARAMLARVLARGNHDSHSNRAPIDRAHPRSPIRDKLLRTCCVNSTIIRDLNPTHRRRK